MLNAKTLPKTQNRSISRVTNALILYNTLNYIAFDVKSRFKKLFHYITCNYTMD